MDFVKAVDLIEKSSYVGLILLPDPGLDSLASAEVMLRILEKRGKKTGFLAKTELKNAALAPLFEKTALSPALPREFVVSLDTDKSPVSQLRYERLGSKLEVIFSPSEKPIENNHFSFREGNTLCDCLISIGVPDIEALNGSWGADPGFFTERPIINLDNSTGNKNYGEVNLVSEENTPISEITHTLLSSWTQEPLDKDSAGLILAGLLGYTEGLRSPETRADTLLLSSELVRLGADYKLAQEIFYPPLPLELLQLSSRASVRSKLDDTKGVLWSFITSEDFAKTGRSPQDIPMVLNHIRKGFPPHRIGAFLWQSPVEKTVQAILYGDGTVLRAVRSQGEGEFQSPYLKLASSFTTFKEAEERINQLLGAVL